MSVVEDKPKVTTSKISRWGDGCGVRTDSFANSLRRMRELGSQGTGSADASASIKIRRSFDRQLHLPMSQRGQGIRNFWKLRAATAKSDDPDTSTTEEESDHPHHDTMRQRNQSISNHSLDTFCSEASEISASAKFTIEDSDRSPYYPVRQLSRSLEDDLSECSSIDDSRHINHWQDDDDDESLISTSTTRWF